MPELPDITVYMEALAARVQGERLERVELKTPFLLRSVEPPLREAEGQRIVELRRVGKRIAMRCENGVWLVLHLMIAGRLHWNRKGGKVLASFVFSSGTLHLTEAGTQRRASLHLTRDPAALDPAGVEPLECTLAEFAAALRRENHTVKNALIDPHTFSGIGNAYSDEILHRARMSPLLLTQKMSDGEIGGLFEATRVTLVEWTDRLRAEAAGEFPEKVTGFRAEMAVHGRHKLPCPVCGATVQRIRYATNETNYCPGCQTKGKVLADRAMSRLLK